MFVFQKIIVLFMSFELFVNYSTFEIAFIYRKWPVTTKEMRPRFSRDDTEVEMRQNNTFDAAELFSWSISHLVLMVD